MKNKLRKALLSRKPAVGSWIQIGHPTCAEIFARAGCDWVSIDLEHGLIDLETMASLFRGVSAFDCVPVARLPLNDPIWIHRCLDAGAGGLMIPMIKTAEEAEAAVREAKYPPRGVRGFGYGRANLHGVDFDEYVTNANDEIPMIMQFEHVDALDNLDAILDIDGVDGLLVGTYDLSGSMGLVGQVDHPKVIEAMDTCLAACKAHNKAAGIHIVRPTSEKTRKALDQGYTLIALGLDTVFLDTGVRTCLKAARQ